MSTTFRRGLAQGYRYWQTRGFIWVTFGLITLIYLINKSPYVGFHDSLGFLYDAAYGFVPATNATSHLLYNNLQHLVVTIFPFIPEVLLLTLFSIFFSLFALRRIYQIGRLFTGRIATSLFTVLIMAFSFTWWQQSEIIEVYAFSNFLFLTLFYFALKDLKVNQRAYLYWVPFFWGLCLLTHIQHILALPFVFYYVLSSRQHSPLQKAAALGIGLGMGSILFLPPLLWQTNTVSSIFFDSAFQGEVLGIDPMGILKGLGMGIAFLVYNFHVFLYFIVDGWIRLWRKNPKLFKILLLLLLPWLAFAVKYSVNDNHVFYLIPYIVLVSVASLSVNAWLKRWKGKIRYVAPLFFLLPPLFYGGTWLVSQNVSALEKYAEEKAYKGGLAHLFWPGSYGAEDPLELARELYEKDPDLADTQVEWNLQLAIDYLKLKGELPVYRNSE